MQSCGCPLEENWGARPGCAGKQPSGVCLITSGIIQNWQTMACAFCCVCGHFMERSKCLSF
uniref:Uncharacterized protein n=1 Tax=Triticum urartu TaxID=4572 RepID=A0A8R7TU93_TRIUA